MNLKGKNILLTGATGGIGTHLARNLASEGANLSLVACPGNQLQELSENIQAMGVKAVWYDYDLRDRTNMERTVKDTEEHLGPIDVLVNNAGIEITAPYHTLSIDDIDSIVSCNLRAPLILSNLLLPGMLERKCGHIVNISSLAGKSGPSCQEVYAATKAGLIGFTASLRATYRNSPVSASVLCPGFVEAGIYDRLKHQTGLQAPKLLGTSRPEKVADAVTKAIKKNSAEIIINPIPVRPLFATTALFPHLGEWLTGLTGAHRFFDRCAENLHSGEK